VTPDRVLSEYNEDLIFLIFFLQIDQPNNIFNRLWKIWGYVKPKNALAGFRDSAPDPTGGACNAPPDPLAETSNILFEIITELLRKKQFWACNAN